ncbi:LuxR C-terminal-related transcriptional regulator [Paenibacillus filicis]|uniref:LuxR C-terminal-related transcriptional regulator n=1 Tax=Paenibacillus gyeongsangnamensis TaxID=3388067 RepID=A0ABT4QKB4_9BACL|nr:LuxR C-terminal-related transcriptional regulator [Paenibacillus filicis]MCZ8517303.1 LuxR C-terminal-related transcriptional regulator [Paenibacillus filicis]
MILSTKLHIPQTRRDGLAERVAITKILNEGLKCKLTAVMAPGGYGKTTVLSQWLQQNGIPAVWVSLDAQDNDLIQFWSYAIAAVSSKHPHFAEAVSPYLSSLKSGAFEPFVTAMIHELNHCSDELVIVFDDYHSINLAPIHASVAYFLAHMPAHIHLYITSRAEMPFPTARLQTTGQMVKITIQDLRFQLGEGIRYFQDCMGLSLSSDEIANLVSRTEGWISGLHLAAISLQRSDNYPEFIRAFSGEHRSISDYLFQEAFSLQSEEMQSFLLQTSILDRMNGPLCEAVIGQVDSQALLETLEHRNLFIIPLDDRREWYRYHHLFSEFLRRLFRQRYAARSKELHIKAAGWLEEHGFVEEAVEQLLLDGHYFEASSLIEKHLQDLHVKRGVLYRWLHDLPEPCLAGKPGIQLLYVKVMIEANEMALAESRLRLIEDKLSDPAWKPYEGTILYVSAMVSFYLRDLRRSNDYLELFDRHMPEGSYIQMIEANSSSIHFDTLLSFFKDLHEAEHFFYKWIKVWENRENYPYIGFFYNAYSALLYEWNRLEEAEAYVEKVLRSKCMEPYAVIMVNAVETAAQIYRAKGDSANAFDWLERVKLKINSADERIFVREIEAEQAYLSLLNGSFDESWLQTCGIKHTDTIPPGSIREYLHLARALMECGRDHEALQLLEQLYRLVDEEDWLWDKVKVSILQSIAFYRKGDMANAMMKLEAALQLAEPSKFIRSFLDEGAKMAELLREYVRQRARHSNRKSAGVSLLYVRELLQLMTDHMNETASSGALTKQELKILRMIDMGQSNKQIAEQLQITAETVKSHLKSMYRKLDVNSREQALKQGKDLELL